jgi:hypothetical protein
MLVVLLNKYIFINYISMVAETFLDTSKVGKELKSDIVFDGKTYNTSLFLAPNFKRFPRIYKNC